MLQLFLPTSHAFNAYINVSCMLGSECDAIYALFCLILPKPYMTYYFEETEIGYVTGPRSQTL